MACNCNNGIRQETLANLMRSINQEFKRLEERVAKTEFTLAEAVRTVRRLEYQLELLDDRDTRSNT